MHCMEEFNLAYPSDSNLDYAILNALHRHGQPLGSGTLHYTLREQGGNLSAPTLGRRLRDLEQRGLVKKVSVEGRVLTAEGQRLLRGLEQNRRLEISGEKVLTLLKRTGKKDIVDQLIARRAVEVETCALAAQNARPADIKHLQKLMQRQRDSVQHGGMGVKEDVDFHDAIAEASGNSVLAAMVSMLRSPAWLNHVVTAIRARFGTRLVIDHEQITRSIKARDSEAAGKAMQQHLDNIIADVDRYWEQEFSNGPKL